MIIVIVIIAIASLSTAFSPPVRISGESAKNYDYDDVVFSAVGQDDGLDPSILFQFRSQRYHCYRHRPSSSLFMNKKKRSPSSSGAKGFGGAGDGSSSSTSTSASSAHATAIKSNNSSTSTAATTIQPKQPPSNFKYGGSIRPGLQSPKRSVPSFSSGKKIVFPDYAMDGKPKARPALFPWIIEVKKSDEIEKMRRAGRVAREVLDLAGRSIEVGITT